MTAPPAGLDIVRRANARRWRLTVDPTSGAVRLTLPHRAALAPALAWAAGQQEWIAAQRARLPSPRPFEPGAVLMVDDVRLVIAWQADWPRRVEAVAGELRCGGPAERLPGRVARWLRAQALDRLSAETGDFARRLGVSIAGVAVGDPRGRWGSCTSTGVIRYSWRLILAPGWVRRATVAHEVAHRVHMHHGPDFHALVAELVGADADRSRAWLRREGAGLHWFGRES
ncbi:YgjP-like metallopeptidase domain-containing protein [Sphingomonas sp.]|uniref:M48 family metallopeptidase n=1 Tax=Sphingomonas sp. TaxID=28214 RepID=UPI001DFEA315|nr:YgjP-like metallopeptidase domain-containing protein [Sphingomonas sp.]MBX9795530.1 M48 family metallopeptidase [Sphingomonas sp.]